MTDLDQPVWTLPCLLVHREPRLQPLLPMTPNLPILQPRKPRKLQAVKTVYLVALLIFLIVIIIALQFDKETKLSQAVHLILAYFALWGEVISMIIAIAFWCVVGAWLIAAIHRKIAGFQKDEVCVGTAKRRAQMGKADSVGLHSKVGHLSGEAFPANHILSIPEKWTEDITAGHAKILANIKELRELISTAATDEVEDVNEVSLT